MTSRGTMSQPQPQRINEADTDMDEDERVLYQGVPFTGEVVETDEDGVVIGLNTYLDGRENGPQRAWYDDGTPRSEYQATAGVPTGESHRWHWNGKLARRQQYDEFGVVRLREVWDVDGVAQPGQYINSW